jgi:cystathionine gamma-lyase
MGAVPSPFDAYMALRGLKTLHVRMEAAARNALVRPSFHGFPNHQVLKWPGSTWGGPGSTSPPPSTAPQAIAQFLESHSQVTKVVYPGLPSHPQYEIAQRCGAVLVEPAGSDYRLNGSRVRFPGSSMGLGV